jgi:quinol-cytochrome oxidoreductase complex cytochrome b subunit
MASDEGSAQTLQSRDEPTATSKADSAKAADWWIWARLIAVIVFVVLVLAGVFFAGFFTRGHFGNHYNQEDVAPGQPACVQPEWHPMGRGGQHCYYQPVPCP